MAEAADLFSANKEGINQSAGKRGTINAMTKQVILPKMHAYTFDVLFSNLVNLVFSLLHLVCPIGCNIYCVDS